MQNRKLNEFFQCTPLGNNPRTTLISHYGERIFCQYLRRACKQFNRLLVLVYLTDMENRRCRAT